MSHSSEGSACASVRARQMRTLTTTGSSGSPAPRHLSSLKRFPASSPANSLRNAKRLACSPAPARRRTNCGSRWPALLPETAPKLKYHMRRPSGRPLTAGGADNVAPPPLMDKVQRSQAWLLQVAWKFPFERWGVIIPPFTTQVDSEASYPRARGPAASGGIAGPMASLLLAAPLPPDAPPTATPSSS